MYRVLSLNAWTSPERLLERTETIAKGIIEQDPALVCLQEISSGVVKQLLAASWVVEPALRAAPSDPAAREQPGNGRAVAARVRAPSLMMPVSTIRVMIIGRQ